VPDGLWERIEPLSVQWGSNLVLRAYLRRLIARRNAFLAAAVVDRSALNVIP
jgi:hypothetical protein